MLKQIGSFFIAVLLLVIAFIHQESYRNSFTEAQQANLISDRISLMAASLEKEISRLSEANFRGISQSRYPLFLMDSVSVVRWNSFEFLPDLRLTREDFHWKFFQNQRGIFLLYKKRIDASISVLSYIPLYTKYPISNKYLTAHWNEKIFPYSGVELSSSEGAGSSITLDGTTIFKLTLQQPLIEIPTNIVAIALLALSLVFFGIAIFLVAQYWHRQKKYERVFLWLLFILVGVRIAMLAANLPQRWINSPLFDPQIFASSSYNSSVGDLFLNTIAVLICCGYIFFNYTRFDFLYKLSNLSTPLRFAVGVVLLLVCFLAFLFPFLFIETIFHNSSISLDITESLQFDLVRQVTFTSVIMGTIAAFFIIHVGFRLTTVVMGHGHTKFLAGLTLAVMLFIAYSILLERDYWITLITCLIFISALYYTRQFSFLGSVNPKVFLYATLTIAAFATQAALATRRFAEEKRIESQFRFGRNFLVSRDILGEYLLDQASRRIASDPFIQSRLATPFLNQDAVRNKIKQIDLSGYFDRYEVEILLFSVAGKRMDAISNPDMVSAIEDMQENSAKTDYPGIYLIQSNSQYIRRYVVLVPVDRSGVRVGYVVLELSLKKVIPHSVYPELLLDNRFSQFFSKDNFSYAFFQYKVMELSFGKYNYVTSSIVNEFGNSELFNTGFRTSDGIHTAIEDDYGRVVLVSSDPYPFFLVVTNFSFYFVISLALILIVLLGYTILRYSSNFQLTYSLKIQLYIYTALVLPLIAVTFAVLTSMSNYSEQEIKNDYEKRSRLYADQVAELLMENKDDSVSASEVLRQQLTEFTRIISIDATVYNSEGRLVASTQPAIFENALISNLINPFVLNQIIKEGEPSVITSERIGMLSYSNVYSSLRDPSTGSIIGILSLPFFDSLASFERTKINTLSLMLTIFVIVFTLFSVLSAYAVSWLTFPLQYITKTLRATTFSGRNKKMEWKADDEIGMMVKEYNRMVDNLEQTKIDLARTQKERAWREMAQQVAHEIKNPLTSMKLTLQQLQLAIMKDQLDHDRLKGSIDSILTQVDILNDIASSFNSFARMPAPELHPLDIVDLMNKSIALHNTEEIEIRWNRPSTLISVLGDDQLLTRIFSNLILNAKQSVVSGRNVVLDVKLVIDKDFCQLSFADNGDGIDDAIRDKVFIPHFSTKKSGSGLGLAIAKQGIEQSGGAIWFETGSSGTIFYIRLPLSK